MSNYAIEVENLCIQYKGVQSFSIKTNLLKNLRKKPPVVEAVKNVSFKLEKGEILGIVGKNGSGKSTMLRAIAGIFSPNSGTIDLHGNSISLLSIGVGFQKELTGRENIRLSGLLLGFTDEEIRKKEKAIIEFSELGQFIDAPVQTYSSGMYSKLAFAITANLETDIILIDEILSVGDIRFRRKSSAKMRELINDKDRTVIIVSHDHKTISSLCGKVLWIHEGELMRFGDTKEVMEEYEAFMTDQEPMQPTVKRAYLEVTDYPENASFQWQYLEPLTGKWCITSAPGSTTARLEGRTDFQYRCAIAAPDGTISYTEAMTPNEEDLVDDKENESAPQNEDASQELTLEVTDFAPDSTFQWQYFDQRSNTWKNSLAKGAQTAKILARRGFKYRCLIMNESGDMRFSDVMQLPPDPNRFTTLRVPEYKEGAAFRWQCLNRRTNQWFPSSCEGKETPELTARKGYTFRCRITDPDGTVHFTEAMTAE